MTGRALVFLSGFAQWEQICARKPYLMKGTTFATADLELVHELERARVDYCDLWEYLPPEDLAENRHKAEELVKTWYRPYLGDTEFHGIKMAEVSQQDLFWPSNACLNTALAIRRVLGAAQPARVVAFADLWRPLSWAATACSETDLVEAVVLWLTEQFGIPVSRLFLDRIPGKQRPLVEVRTGVPTLIEYLDLGAELS